METMYCKTISAGNSLDLDLNLEDVGADITPRALSPRKTANAKHGWCDKMAGGTDLLALSSLLQGSKPACRPSTSIIEICMYVCSKKHVCLSTKRTSLLSVLVDPPVRGPVRNSAHSSSYQMRHPSSPMLMGNLRRRRSVCDCRAQRICLVG